MAQTREAERLGAVSMIRLLAEVGRLLTAGSALLIIAAGTLVGWEFVDLLPPGQYLGIALYPTSDTRGTLAVIGAVIGLLVAGTVYGLFAAIYDTNRLIRRLVAVSERCEVLLRSDRAGNP